MREGHVGTQVQTAYRHGHQMIHRPACSVHWLAADVAAPSIALGYLEQTKAFVRCAWCLSLVMPAVPIAVALGTRVAAERGAMATLYTGLAIVRKPRAALLTDSRLGNLESRGPDVLPVVLGRRQRRTAMAVA